MEANNRRIKRIFLLIMLLCFIPSLKGEDYEYAHRLVRNDDINGALVEYNRLVNIAMDKRSQYRGVDPVLIAEYGYVLALANVYDVALVTLDEALNNAKALPKKSVVKEVNYYVYEVLMLMKYDSLAMPFQKECSSPEWISEQELLALRTKYATAPIINREDFKTTFTRINKLTENQSLLQALVLSEELTFFYAKQPFSAMTKGDAWEQLGFYPEALSCYQKVKEMSEGKDSLLYHTAEQQAKAVQKKSSDPFTKFKLKYNPRMMMYLGGVFSLSSASVSARVGIYTNTQFSASLNFSYSHLYDEYSNSFFIGLSAYKRFFNVLAVGFGLNQQFGNGDYNIYVAPSVGASFYIIKKRMSMDIFYNLNIPCMYDTELQHTISFGVTTYF